MPIRHFYPALAVILVCSRAGAQEACTPSAETVCLPKTDFQKFLDIATERQCLERTTPVFQIDSVAVMTDEQGRVFYTGADPQKPYTLSMRWCQYEIEAAGKIDLVAAMKAPVTSGFRFRPKAYLGYLPFKLSKGKFHDGIDAGMMIDFLFIDWVNLNVAAGFRSVGLAVGADLTANFGAYVGYALGWTAPLHNINAGISFAF